MSRDDHEKSSSPIGCAVIVIVFAAALIAVGLLVRTPAVTETRGVITESRVGWSAFFAEPITYQYTINGKIYTGHSIVRSSSQLPRIYDVGLPVTVFYENDHPDQSYALSPARPWVLAVLGFMILVLGSGMLLFGSSRIGKEAGNKS